ncbi:N-acetylmuramidase domain-containing protein [Burkholderia gladioli]|uniref:N-acetylmuramidase domain-containing protein n=1 Tax=Burkholderia gladioli TaxID=28095 RepID=UPI00163E7A68|nr:N-acetylmuramidase family protein [Burkholderia gladioli]
MGKTELRVGSLGDAVDLLQRKLKRAGVPVSETALYDEQTQEAVRTFQASVGLVVDGIAGSKTLAALDSRQVAPHHLRDVDLVAAAATLDVEVAAIRAVNEVESRGEGFLPDGRPVILFERHEFWKRLVVHGIDPQRIAGAMPNVLSQQRGGYLGGAAEYVRLSSALRVCKVAAWESASWGAFQIMGYHWERLGYADAEAFVRAMDESEGTQLDAFCRFLQADPSLLAALAQRQWASFAKLYNGAGYAANLYDVKLARAYARYCAQAKAVA